MTNFQFIRQQTIDLGYQGVCLTEFSLTKLAGVSEEKIIEAFLHSSNYSYESLREEIKQNSSKPFLKHAFEQEYISLTDFKNLSKDEIIKFLNDFESTDDWGNTDRNDFSLIKNQFLNILNPVNDNSFYLISKDWFAKGDPKVRKPENWMYIYYFVIIWVSNDKLSLTISEWTYD